ncbi:MAG: endolytic transglycosylase MltG [Bacteroidales bacterium]|nr:endolytic transglycosylase MltG [Bacteroidales bacterium]
MIFNLKVKTGWIIIFFLVLFFSSLIIWLLYSVFWRNAFDIDKREYIYIEPESTVDEVTRQFGEYAYPGMIFPFHTLYNMLELNRSVPEGAYIVEPGNSLFTFLKRLYRRQQTPVLFTFNNVRTLDGFAERAGKSLLLSGDSLLKTLEKPEVAARYGFTPETVVAMFIPNTYELYWNVSIDRFLARMKREYDSFWTLERKAKAEKQGLTPLEVSILASIVEEESKITDEYPVIAGLYLNRLRKGMPLQADPTVKFAVGDPALKRILNEHLEIESPYNTYKKIGLPPGPIRIPSSKAIDGVLNAAQHPYLYMCAKEDFSGRHNFSTNLNEHTRNAMRYRRALDRLNIR